MNSPYLNHPKRSEPDAEASRLYRQHHDNLVRLLVELNNAGAPQQQKDAVHYALDAIVDRQADRLKARVRND